MLDEQKGRRTARQLGIPTAGILAVLLDAKAEGRLSAIAPVLDALERDARFFLGAVVREHVLAMAGEAN